MIVCQQLAVTILRHGTEQKNMGFVPIETAANLFYTQIVVYFENSLKITDNNYIRAIQRRKPCMR